MEVVSTIPTSSIGNTKIVMIDKSNGHVETPGAQDINCMSCDSSHRNIGKDGQEISLQGDNVNEAGLESTPKPPSPSLKPPSPSPKPPSPSPPSPKPPSPSTSPAPSHEPLDKKLQTPPLKPEDLRRILGPSIEKLYRLDPESIPFRTPVVPEVLGLPNYFDIVKKPMDLSTIKRKLDTDQYSEPWDYVDDVWLIFENAWVYNKKKSRVYRYCTKLARCFERDIYPVMQSLGYCCGRKYTFSPQVLYCYGKQPCTIPKDGEYFSYQDRYTFCAKCFEDIQGATISLKDDPSHQDLKIRKSKFEEMRNDVLESEPMVECLDCGRKQHKICVHHMEQSSPNGFTCDTCLKNNGQKKIENTFTAENLPTTKMSNYLETRINGYLKKWETGAGEVFIRVVSSSDKTVKVKGGMKTRFADKGKIAAEFPYRAKALYAYEEIDGVDVCFFGMHVQEYGSDAACPNARQVYIAYLDSVHFFKPSRCRTAVYQEILLGYLDYVKQLGYTKAHIWAIPPSEGDDYIFNVHPSEQKMPKPKRLQNWYKKLLDKGITEGILLEYKDIHKQTIDDDIKSPAELPYFEGDFWPNVMEESIKEIDLEEQNQNEEKVVGDEGKEVGINGKNLSESQCKDLSQKIFTTMEKHTNSFYIIRLHSSQSAVSLSPIQDPDPIIICDLMDGRDAFLYFAIDRHLEFSTLRRAKFSTRCMLYELHNQGQERFVYICDICKCNVETSYHCEECDDYDLCPTCFKTEGHPHKMIRLGFDLDDSFTDTEHENLTPQEARQQSIQRSIQSLVHASQCCDVSCCLPSCQKMKSIVSHAKTCKNNSNDGCAICKQLMALSSYHAKACKEEHCEIPYCDDIKQKLSQQEMQQRLQQQLLMKRRMQQMNPGSESDAAPQPGLPAEMDLSSLTPQSDDSINLDEDSKPADSSNDSVMLSESNKRSVEILCSPETPKRVKS